MISIGQVYCEACGDAFEPEGLPSFDEPNFCSEECVDQHLNGQAYDEARYGGASVF